MEFDYHVFKSMANNYLSRHVGGKQRPTFFDIGETCPALDRVTEAYPVIRRELDRLLAGETELLQYHELDPGESKISSATPKRWNVYMLEIMGHRPQANRAAFPETCRVLDQIPNIIQAFFSILDPGKSIPQHDGPYLGYLRYHLGIKVPSRNPPKLVVNAQDYVWKEGEAVLFDDSWPHAVVNSSDELRAVLIVDVRRPLPPVPNLFNRLLLDVVARHTYGRAIARKADQFARARAGQRAAA